MNRELGGIAGDDADLRGHVGWPGFALFLDAKFFGDAFPGIAIGEVARGEAVFVGGEVGLDVPEPGWELAMGFVFVVGAWAGLAAGAVVVLSDVGRMWIAGLQFDAAPGPVFVGAADVVGIDF